MDGAEHNLRISERESNGLSRCDSSGDSLSWDHFRFESVFQPLGSPTSNQQPTNENTSAWSVNHSEWKGSSDILGDQSGKNRNAPKNVSNSETNENSDNYIFSSNFMQSDMKPSVYSLGGMNDVGAIGSETERNHTGSVESRYSAASSDSRSVHDLGTTAASASVGGYHPSMRIQTQTTSDSQYGNSFDMGPLQRQVDTTWQSVFTQNSTGRTTQSGNLSHTTQDTTTMSNDMYWQSENANQSPSGSWIPSPSGNSNTVANNRNNWTNHQSGTAGFAYHNAETHIEYHSSGGQMAHNEVLQSESGSQWTNYYPVYYQGSDNPYYGSGAGGGSPANGTSAGAGNYQQQQHHHQQQAGSPSSQSRGAGAKDRLKAASNPNAQSPMASKMLCPALVEYRTTGRRPTMEELIGHVVEFSRDSHGSRFIQFKMETASVEEKDILVNEVIEDCVGLMQDTFGNYVIQNFMEHATLSQQIALGNTMRGSMIELSSQSHGCRVVQKAIILLPTNLRNALMAELLMNPEDASICSRNSHATHVMQKVVSLIVEEEGQRIHERRPEVKFPDAPSTSDLLRAIEQAVALDFVNLSVHPHAYRLVLTVIDDCKSDRSSAMRDIMESLRLSQNKLAKDQHGNFILQHILSKGSLGQKMMVQDFVAAHVVELSQHKFGSHLVEKCLSCATSDQVDAIVEQLIEPTNYNLEQSKLMLHKIGLTNSPSSGAKKKTQGQKGKILTADDRQSTLLLLMQDPYANFVVQRAFDAARGNSRMTLVKEIKSYSELLQKFTYGRHILIHINRTTGNGSASDSGTSSNSRASKGRNMTPKTRRPAPFDDE